MVPNYVRHADRRFINGKGEFDWSLFNTTDTTNYVEMYSNDTPVLVKNRKGGIQRIGE